jgi:putative PIN family toxin of toxin-antitoxin system
MARGKRNVKRFVIDVNCYITLFINRETDWLLDYVTRNKIEIFIDHNLLSELLYVLEYPKIKNLLPLDSFAYINFVRLVSIQIESSFHHIQSPDAADNYLYDIALSANAKLLVTGEKALIQWTETPLKTISLSQFKKIF